MKIYVKEAKKPAFRLIIPTSLLTGRIAMWILKKAAREAFKDKLEPGALACVEQMDLSRYARQIKEVKRMYPQLYLVDIESHDGTIFKIKL